MEALTRPLAQLGRSAVAALAGMGYAAMLLVDALRLALFGWRVGQPLRLRAVFEQMRQFGVDALPIVCLLAFTVGTRAPPKQGCSPGSPSRRTT